MAFIGAQKGYYNTNRHEIWRGLHRANISIVLMEKVNICDKCEYCVGTEGQEFLWFETSRDVGQGITFSLVIQHGNGWNDNKNTRRTRE